MSLMKRKWMFDRSALQKGDILFTRSEFTGTGIAKATKGNFGHVMLYLDDMVIHADLKGVYSKNTQRILMNKKERLAAFRLKESLSSQHIERIESFARSRVGSIYSIKEAVQSLKNRTNEIVHRYELNTQFCSRLVAQSFADAGINLVDDFDFCTPNEIAKSHLLTEVGNAVIQAGVEDIEFSKTEDYNLQLQKETYKWLEKVRELAEKRHLKPVKSQTDVGQMVLDYPKLDGEICSFIRETKYLDFYDVDERKNPWRYNSLLMFKLIGSNPSFRKILADERALNYSILKRVSEERRKAIHNAQSGLQYFLLEEDLQTMRLAQMNKWKDAIDYVSHIMDA